MPSTPPADPAADALAEADRAVTGAVTGADAYRATRAAVRVERGVVRLGNRFVPLERYREVAFVAFGRAAVSQGFALVDALGDVLTQGFLAGPDAVPSAIPFQHRRVPGSTIGDPAAEAVGAAAIELAGALGPKDLLLVALSPGALGLLAQPPEGVGAEAYRARVRALRAAGASPAEVEGFVRATARGPVAGALAAAGGAEVVPLVVDRGVAPALVGGGPTLPITPTEIAAVRATHARLAPGIALGPELERALDRAPVRPARAPARPIVVAAPADALQGAGDALSEAKWWSRLAGVDLSGDPDSVGDVFLDRIEEILPGVPRSREARKGIAIFASGPLACPDGEGEGEAVARLLAQLPVRSKRRDVRYAVFRTAGARPGEAGTAAGLVEPGRSGSRPLPSLSEGKPGVTDVGPVLLALVPDRPAP